MRWIRKLLNPDNGLLIKLLAVFWGNFPFRIGRIIYYAPKFMVWINPDWAATYSNWRKFPSRSD